MSRRAKPKNGRKIRKYVRGRLAILTVGVLSLTVIPLGAVQATPVEDIIGNLVGCRLFADTPTITRGNGLFRSDTVSGYGGITQGCTVISDTPTVEVCLDYNGVTIPTTCRRYITNGPTGAAPCLPGIWQTVVFPLFPALGGTKHSDPLIVTTQCPKINNTQP